MDSLLSSDKMSEKIASAILFRRFMDENTEFGVSNAPFKQETINVIAGLLRYKTTSDFQKILGDGLYKIKQHLNAESIYNNSKENVKTACEDVKKIFVCSQGCMSIKQKVIYDYVLSQLKSCEQKIIVEILSRDKYQYFGITTELKRNIQTSDGVIVFGFSDIFIQEGVFRAETNEEKKIEAADYMSPWIHTEIGIAIGSSKPIFLIHEEAIQDGVSEDTINEFNITKIYTNTIETNFDIHLNKWLQSIEKK